MRFFKIVAPYALAVISAIGIFAAGAYTGMHFTTEYIFTPRLGQEQVARVLEDHTILHHLDKGELAEAHKLLDLREGGNVFTLNSLASYLPNETAITACKALAVVGKRRNEFSAKYPNNLSPEYPELYAKINDVLKKPEVCNTGKT